MILRVHSKKMKILIISLMFFSKIVMKHYLIRIMKVASFSISNPYSVGVKIKKTFLISNKTNIIKNIIIEKNVIKSKNPDPGTIRRPAGWENPEFASNGTFMCWLNNEDITRRIPKKLKNVEKIKKKEIWHFSAISQIYKNDIGCQFTINMASQDFQKEWINAFWARLIEFEKMLFLSAHICLGNYFDILLIFLL